MSTEESGTPTKVNSIACVFLDCNKRHDKGTPRNRGRDELHTIRRKFDISQNLC